jgi:hypothetical protein
MHYVFSVVLRSRCFVTALNHEDSSASTFNGSCPRWLATISHLLHSSFCSVDWSVVRIAAGPRQHNHYSLQVSSRRLTIFSPTQSYSYVATDGHSARFSLCQAPSRATTQIFVSQLRICRCGAPLWWKDGSVIYDSCWPCQRSHPCVRVPRDSWPHFLFSNSRLPQPGGPGTCIYIPPPGLMTFPVSWKKGNVLILWANIK